MQDNIYEIHAIKYAQLMRRSGSNFIGGDEHDTEMPLDYFVWVIRNRERTIVVDTGFDEAMAKKRGRQLLHPVGEGLQALGIRLEDVRDVIVTHLHYDHAGNHDLLPNARYHLQDAEMEFATGRCMCHHALRHGYEAEDVASMVRRVFEDRVVFCAGVSELAPGVELHRLGGHTRGMQIVRVRTARGWVVLASDASHFYANMERDASFPIVYNMFDMLEGFRQMQKLATSQRHIIPGHDPLVLSRFPPSFAGSEGWIARLDAEPLR